MSSPLHNTHKWKGENYPRHINTLPQKRSQYLVHAAQKMTSNAKDTLAQTEK